ncbi:hypothetical protein RAMLITH_01405 [Ramlibacter sp. RBP-2]|uniref:MFS transporter permease n=1 Tax=Ramlibacter lithotrophicus TaxID=2606681 RepID=A0A7X6I4W2_9BURK|nr:DUF6064 family protein [Ramlibacter lithotrophicus]NKE64464.1 hypothetical protein [Ramlibacter lithotrophicus]
MFAWSSYGPRDFLMFAPRTYWRLVEIYNQDLWPWQPAVLAAGVALAWHAARRGAGARRITCAALALAWLWVAWGFHWERFATINWGARHLAAAGVLQAVLLLAAALRAPDAPLAIGVRGMHRAGVALALGATIAYPLATAAAGASWRRAELAGLMPEATALVTLGLVVATRPRRWPWLVVLPLLTLLLGAATLWLLATR